MRHSERSYDELALGMKNACYSFSFELVRKRAGPSSSFEKWLPQLATVVGLLFDPGHVGRMQPLERRESMRRASLRCGGIAALRDQAGRAASDSRGRWSVPFRLF